MNNFPPTYSARENALKEDTPTPEQLNDALKEHKSLNQPLYPSDKPPYYTLEDLGQWAYRNEQAIQFALRFTAKALGEPSEDACIAFETRGGSTRLRAKAMIQQIAKECVDT